MSELKKMTNIFVFAIILTIISISVIVANGKTYTKEIKLPGNLTYEDNIDVYLEQEKESLSLESSRISSNIVEVKLNALEKGKAYLNINLNGEEYYTNSVYVHNMNIITYGSYFGNCTGGIVVPICVTVFMVYFLVILIKEYRKNIKENMYQYKNIAYMGIIIFTSFSLLNRIYTLFTFRTYGIINIINDFTNMAQLFSVLLLPFALITAILVTISNIVLVKREGLNYRNLLGLILGVLLCFGTIASEIFNLWLRSMNNANIYNLNSIYPYLENVIETAIYIIVSYLECILFGAIILSLKAARHIPKYDKDYILILGCQIKKDGTLTPLLKARADRAIEFSKMQKENTGKNIVFIPSGGKGTDEVIAEAQAVKNYLMEQGIKEENIIVEDKSKNTYENVKLSDKIIRERNKDAKVAFSTTNYHVFRGGAIAKEQNLNYEGIGAKTKTYFWINAFIREYITTLFLERKGHIIAVSILNLSAIVMIFVMYLSNVL